MVLQEFFTERQIELLYVAVSAQEKKWHDISKRPVRGYGKATEQEKKLKREMLAQEYNDLLQKLKEHTI